jgi:hypothetical protein
MPLTLVTTVGAADANSYATVDEADAYNLSRVFATDWADLDTDVKLAALMSAARLLDDAFVWTGTAVDAVQALTWPRVGMLTRNGFAIGTTTIPTELKNAQSVLARQLNAADRLADSDAEKQGISSLRAGSVAVTFKQTSGSTLELQDADLRRLEPELAWASRAVPDAVRLMLVPSWYVREQLQQPISFRTIR